jgi:hypothetical protein
VLGPSDRRLLLDALAPPDGYELDQAIGTTYTLDLVALLRVPLAATTLPWSEGDGEPVSNPFALLSALRRHADRISLFCHAGAIKVPPRQQPLFTFLEGCVNQVVPPRGGVFHPKLWLLRFIDRDGGPVAYRLLVLSRNLTFDRCWDIALVLDGELTGRSRAIAINHPLADLLAALPAMARSGGNPVTAPTAARVELLADEARRVRWANPEDFDLLAFHALGHDDRVHWPFPYLYKLLVVSPFVSQAALATLGGWPYVDASLVARFEELAKLPESALESFDEVFAFDDGQGLLDADNPYGDEALEELAGLHAKLFLGEVNRRARIWVGSANATQEALGTPEQPGGNVELLVELHAVRSHHGISPTRARLIDAGLLKKFVPGEPVEVDELGEALERDLERLATRLASGKLRAVVATEGPDRHRIELRCADGSLVVPHGIEVMVRPITLQLSRTAHLERDPVAVFPVIALANITPFFAFTITARREAREKQHDFVARLELEGAPEGRAEAVMADLLSDPQRLIAFLLLLLATDGSDAETALDSLDRIAAGRPSSSGAGGSFGLPLLEPMLRALDRDPDRLDKIARVIADLRANEQTAALIPQELTDLWATVDAVRQQ